jgi:hypothetical protein
MRSSIFLFVVVILVDGGPSGAEPPKPTDSSGSTPESRAVAYLAREVPRWSAENKCYSCHNNGDAARALYTAVRLKYTIASAALEDTSRWLARPGDWDNNGGKAGYSDKGLARIQFAAALVEAVDARQVKGESSLPRAAELVAEHQQPDGSWKVDAEGTIGSPATYGSCLATYQALRTLRRADAKRYRTAIARADQWLRKVPVKSVLDAAAVSLALGGSDDRDARAQRGHCLALVRKGQAKEGGWGPHVNSPPEPFDSAVVILALLPLAHQPDVPAMLQRGRAYLTATQRADGSWPETTRPPGADSYAQRLSTAGWATLALLATADKQRESGK